MSRTPTGRKVRTREEWQRLLEKQEQSGSSIGVSCKDKGLARTSFDKWKNRLSGEQKQNRADFIELDAPETIAIRVEL